MILDIRDTLPLVNMPPKDTTHSARPASSSSEPNNVPVEESAAKRKRDGKSPDERDGDGDDKKPAREEDLANTTQTPCSDPSNPYAVDPTEDTAGAITHMGTKLAALREIVDHRFHTLDHRTGLMKCQQADAESMAARHSRRIGDLVDALRGLMTRVVRLEATAEAQGRTSYALGQNLERVTRWTGAGMAGSPCACFGICPCHGAAALSTGTGTSTTAPASGSGQWTGTE